MAQEILKVQNLSVAFDGQNVLDNVEFSVNKGEALAIIGPNGAGKSVLFRALLGLVPYTGIIQWDKSLSIGYVPQKLQMGEQSPITVKEFFLLRAPRFWRAPKTFIKHLSHELSLVGLENDVLEKNLGDLSTGQLQRLLISWAMINHPDVLLFDEPTAGIDVGFAETVYTLIHRLQKERGTTILLISHDLHIVYRYANKVLCLNKEMICNGPPREVLNAKELALLYGEGGYYEHTREGGHHVH
jgi:zinc transport system ATP-binding protein